jgi:putative alpha-1,2-mannosidase
MTTMYTDQPDGLCGNEDCGQMSAWYVLSAMGFYPVHPANGVYVLGSPEVDKATIVSAGKKPFTIEAVNNSEKNIYIQSVQYNGQPYTKGYITHSMITKGGTLTLEMGPEPNKSFAVAPADRPKSEL